MDFKARSLSFGPAAPCVLIGEIGVNHNNDLDMLMRLIEEGTRAGFDVLKLQRFVAEEEISQFAPSAEYQAAGGDDGGQLAIAKALELGDDALFKAEARCRELGVGFLCSAFDYQSVDFVAEKLGCKSVKIASSEVDNDPLLTYMARKFDGLILSTGASELSETARAVEVLRGTPAPTDQRELAVMHCVSEYPAPVEEANLRTVPALAEALALPVGFSDHTLGPVAAVAAVALGARVLEKHYTLDKSLPGPDHRASADIPEVTAYIRAVRDAEASLGDGHKRPAPSEADNRALIRKALVCAVPHIEAGTALTREMIGAKRPAAPGAVAPADLEKVVGLRLTRSRSYDEPILWEDFRG